MKRLDLRDKVIMFGKRHYFFDLNGRRFAYAYIRKNACSAFKDLICQTSREADYESFGGNQLDFLNRFHAIRRTDTLESCDRKLFVYRDPYERVISIFVNKFVAQTGNKAIFSSYRDVTGFDPNEATFESFVRDYCRDFRSRDVHIERQSRHLLPIAYDAAISIKSLQSEMSELIGSELATRYFEHKRNSSTYGVEMKDQFSVSARDLHKIYRKTGALPSKDAFMRDDLIAICKRRYALDYELIDSLVEKSPEPVAVG